MIDTPSQTHTRIIRILSDGKPGHINQSIGLAQALSSIDPYTIEIVNISPEAPIFKRCKIAAEGPADIIIATGHSTHLPLLWASRKTGAQSIVIMKPSLPAWLFDFLIIPEHDSPSPRKNIITSKGPLNKLSPEPTEKLAKGLFLIGGPSKHAKWDSSAIANAIKEIVTKRPQLQWTLTDSRRTPQDFLNLLGGVNLQVLPHTKTESDWLPSELAKSQEVWVTPDSASMIYEALTSRAAVGLLPLKSIDSRVSRGVQQLIEDKLITPYSKNLQELHTPTESFHEATRVAEQLHEKLSLERL